MDFKQFHVFALQDYTKIQPKTRNIIFTFFSIAILLSMTALPTMHGGEGIFAFAEPVLVLEKTERLFDSNGISIVTKETYSNNNFRHIISPDEPVVKSGAGVTDRLIQGNGTHFNVFSGHGSMTFDKSDSTLIIYNYGVNPTKFDYDINSENYNIPTPDVVDVNGNVVYGDIHTEEAYWTVDVDGVLQDASSFDSDITTMQNVTNGKVLKMLDSTRNHASGSYLQWQLVAIEGEPFEDYVWFHNQIAGWVGKTVSLVYAMQGVRGDFMQLPNGENVGDLPVGSYTRTREQIVQSEIGATILKGLGDNPFVLDLEKAKHQFSELRMDVRSDGRVDLYFVFAHNMPTANLGDTIHVDPQYRFSSGTKLSLETTNNHSTSCDISAMSTSVNGIFLKATANSSKCRIVAYEYDTTSIPDWADITNVDLEFDTSSGQYPNGATCEYNPLTNRPAQYYGTSADRITLWNDVDDGTAYATGDTLCAEGKGEGAGATAGVADNVVDLGSVAITDLETLVQAGDNYFGIGKTFSEGLSRNSWDRYMDFDSTSLIVEYTLDLASAPTLTVADTSTSSVTLTSAENDLPALQSEVGTLFFKNDGSDNFCPEPFSVDCANQVLLLTFNGILTALSNMLPSEYVTSYSEVPSVFIEFDDPTFSPTSISNLIGWWDATDSTTITTDTGVSQWDDKSGNANHLTQGTGSNQPTQVTDLAGRNMLDFNSGSTQDISRSTYTGGALTQPFTVIFVGGWDSISAGSYVYDSGSGDRCGVATGSTTYQPYCGVGSSFGTASAGNFIYYIEHNDNSGAFERNESSQGSFASGETNGQNGLVIGNYRDKNPSNDLDGQIGEFLIYDGLLSASDKANLVNYLQEKWGYELKNTATLPNLSSVATVDHDYTEYTTETETDTNYPSTNESILDYDVTSDYLTFNIDNSGGHNEAMSFDIGSTICSEVCTMTGTVDVTTYTQGAGAGALRLWVGLADSTSAEAVPSGTLDFAGLTWRVDTANELIRNVWSDASNLFTNEDSYSTSPSATTYYFKITFNNITDDLLTYLYSDSSMLTLVESEHTPSVTATNFDNIYIGTRCDGTCTGHALDGTIDNIVVQGSGLVLGEVGDGSVTGVTVGNTGIRGENYSFDGTDDYITIGTTETFASMHKANAKSTIMMWIKTDNLDASDRILSTTKDSTTHGWGISTGSDTTQICWQYSAGGGSAEEECSSTGFLRNDGTWEFIALTQDLSLSSEDHKFYHVSGGALVEQSTAPEASIIESTSDTTAYPLNIGQRGDSAHWGQFEIDDLLIDIGTTYSTNEISQYWNNNAGLDIISPTSTVYDELTLEAGSLDVITTTSKPTADMDEDYTDTTGWTQSGSEIDVDSTTADKVTINNAQASTASHVYKAIGETLHNDFTVEFDYKYTAITSSPDTPVFCLTDSTGNPKTGTQDSICISQYSGNNISISYNEGGSFSNGANMCGNIAVNTDYYMTFSKKGSTAYIDVFTDSDRTVHHCSASRSSIPVSVTSFSYISHASGGGTAGRYLTATLDNTNVYVDFNNLVSKYAGSLFFDGSTYYLTATEAETDFDYQESTAMSASFWIYPTDGTNADTILDKRATSNGAGWQIELASDEKIQTTWSDGTNHRACKTDDALSIHQWTHVVVTKGTADLADCTDFNIYLDGTVQSGLTAVASGNPTSASILNDLDVRIGANRDGNQIFNGMLDHIIVASEEFTSAEASALSSYTLATNTITDSSASDGDSYKAMTITESGDSPLSSEVTCAVLSTDGDCLTDSGGGSPGGGSSGGSSGGTSSSSDTDDTADTALSIVSLLTGSHIIGYGVVNDYDFDVEWTTGNDLELIDIVVDLSNAPGFDLVPQDVGPGVFLLGTEGATEENPSKGKIKYTVSSPLKECESTTTTPGCVNPGTYTIPVQLYALDGETEIRKTVDLKFNLTGEFEFGLIVIGIVGAIVVSSGIAHALHKRSKHSGGSKSSNTGKKKAVKRSISHKSARKR